MFHAVSCYVFTEKVQGSQLLQMDLKLPLQYLRVQLQTKIGFHCVPLRQK